VKPFAAVLVFKAGVGGLAKVSLLNSKIASDSSSSSVLGNVASLRRCAIGLKTGDELASNRFVISCKGGL